MPRKPFPAHHTAQTGAPRHRQDPQRCYPRPRPHLSRRHPHYWRHKRSHPYMRWGLQRRLTHAFIFVALAAVGITTVSVLSTVLRLQQELGSDAFMAGASSVYLKDAQTPQLFKRVISNALWAGFWAFLLASFAAAGVTRLLTRPLRALTRGVQRFEAGERDVKVPPPPANDELRQLTLAFNGLTASLERQETWRRNMVSDIAHDLRTPLAVMRSEIEAMQDGVVTLDQEGLQRLHGEVMLLSKLVNDLKTLALADQGEEGLTLSLIPLQPLLKQVSQSFEAAAMAAGSTLTLRVEPANLSAVVDDHQMTRVLHNLVSNAIQYASPGLIEVGAVEEETHVRLWVKDHGQGLGEGVLEQVFERFYRGDGSRNSRQEGSGLGLAIAKAIVEAHGGTITARHHDQGGAIFEILLPYVRGEEDI